MKHINYVYTYTPSRYILGRVKNFSEERMVLSANLYKWRGEKNLEKMKNDIQVGLFGEYAVFNYCKSSGIKCSRPDLKIYENKQKSFDADLKTDKYLIHVKSQSNLSIKRYGLSWLMQRNDKVVKNPGKNEYFAFTSVDLNDNIVLVRGFVKCSDVSDYDLWSECKVFNYRKSKIALYFDDLYYNNIVKKNLKRG